MGRTGAEPLVMLRVNRRNAIDPSHSRAGRCLHLAWDESMGKKARLGGLLDSFTDLVHQDRVAEYRRIWGVIGSVFQ